MADGQYGTVQQLTEAEAQGYEVLTAPGSEHGGDKRGEYAAEKFQYDGEHEQVICPRGERLKFGGMKKKSGARVAVRAYYCQVYRDCPVRELCGAGKKGRRIEISPQRAARDRQREKRKDPAMKALLRRRKAIIEPVFANLRIQKRLDRFTLRGRLKVNVQWMLYCLVHNIEKLANFGATYAMAT